MFQWEHLEDEMMLPFSRIALLLERSRHRVQRCTCKMRSQPGPGNRKITYICVEKPLDVSVRSRCFSFQAETVVRCVGYARNVLAEYIEEKAVIPG